MERTGGTTLHLEETAISAERSELLGGITFLEGVQIGWGAWELIGWMDDYLVAPERMQRAALVHEPAVGSVALDPRHPDAQSTTLPPHELPRILSAARGRVVETLRNFIASPPDDRFLNAAIFANRVTRAARDGVVVWASRPRMSDRLSEIVLSLFAADVLQHREFHEASLCVCAVCGRVSFAPALLSRTGCREHIRRSATNSGFLRRAPWGEADDDE
jgi:hypothetical protein